MQNKFLGLMMAIFIMLSSCTTQTSNSAANSIDFNWDWKFALGEMNSPYSAVECTQGKWNDVRLPHDWSIESGYTQEHAAGSNAFLPGGVGWYRKTFEVPSNMSGKNIFVRFEGVYNNSEVWINGKSLGFYPNGYLDFEYDLTPYLAKGDNVIAARVDRRAYADARWYVGAGIYRNVHLIARNNSYIPTHGVSIVTELNGSNALVNVETEINADSKDKNLSIKHELIYNNAIINSITTPYAKGVTKSQLTAENPKLWSLEDRAMYKLRTTLLKGNNELESRTTPFGIRTAVFTPSKGFQLNGKTIKLKGVNIHHDLGCVGVAAYDAVIYRRLKALRDLGCNAIRTAHNPHSESLLTMCDTMGFIVMDEFVDEWLVAKGKWIIDRAKTGIADSLQTGYSAHFNQWAEKDLKHFIKRDRNHPSVVLWSVGNEIEWTYPYYFRTMKEFSGYQGLVYTGKAESNPDEVRERFEKYSGGKDELAETAHKLVKWVKEIDTHHPVTSGVVIPSVSRISGYTDALDVIGYNYKDTYYELDHKLYPDKCILGSENVSQYFEWAAVADKEYIPGIFVWTGIDYLGENGPWPSKGGHYSFFDFACFKTSRGHFFECLWNDAPKTHIVTTPSSTSEFKKQKDGSFKVEFDKSWLRKWLWYETYDKWNYKKNEKVIVQVYTNAPEVELLLNNKSLGSKKRADFPEENIIVWEVPYQDGELVAVGKENDNEVSRYSLKTAGEIADIVAIADKQTIKSDGYDLAHIELMLIDKDGTPVTFNPQDVKITLAENTKILGVDNGDDKFVGSHKTNSIITHDGRALIIVQPQPNASGNADITLSLASGVSKTISFKYIK